MTLNVLVRCLINLLSQERKHITERLSYHPLAFHFPSQQLLSNCMLDLGA